MNKVSTIKSAFTAILIFSTTVYRYYATLFKKNSGVQYSTVCDGMACYDMIMRVPAIAEPM